MLLRGDYARAPQRLSRAPDPRYPREVLREAVKRDHARASVHRLRPRRKVRPRVSHEFEGGAWLCTSFWIKDCRIGPIGHIDRALIIRIPTDPPNSSVFDGRPGGVVHGPPSMRTFSS